jgi:hypothetical protein
MTFNSGRLTGGTLTKTGGTLNLNSTILNSDIAVANGQLVNVNSGLTFENNHAIYLNDTGGTTTLSINGVQTIGGSGKIVFNGTGSTHRIFTNVSNAIPGIVFDTGVVIDVTNGSGKIDGAGASNQYWENRGTINVAAGKSLGLVTVADIKNYGTINTYGTLTIDPSLSGPLNCCNFHNKGALNALAGTVNLLGNSWDDSGVYNISSGAVLNFNGGGARTFTGIGAGINNAGNVNFTSSSFTMDANSSLAGSGNFGITGATVGFSGSATIGSLTQSGGTLNVDGNATVGNFSQSAGALGGSGVLTVTNNLNWTGGTMSGTGTTKLAAGGTGTISTTSTKTLSRTLRNEGTITESGVTGANYPFRIENGGVLDNAGVFNISDDSRIEYNVGQVIGQILNSGTFAKTGGVGGALVNSLLNNAGGTLQADSGLLDLYANTTLSGISTLNGNVSWRNNANVTLAGDVIGSTGLQIGTNGSSTVTANGNVSVNKLTLVQNGTLTGSGTVTVTDTLNWTGGVMSGTGTTKLAAGGTGTISTANTKWLNRTLRNEGTITESGVTGANYPFRIENGGALDNAGVFNISDDSRIEYNPGQVMGQILKAGTCAKTGGVGTTVIGVVMNNANGGTLQAASGSLSMYQGFNTTGAGYIGSGAGTVAMLSGAGTFGGGMTVAGGSTLVLSNGTLDLADGAIVDGTGVFNWTGGTLNVTGTGAGATIGAGMTLNMANRTIGGSGNLTNLGTVTMSGGTLNANFVNAGLLTVSGAGNTISGSGAFDIDAGTITLNTGATLTKSGGTVNWHGGTLAGSGNLALTGGAAFNVNGSGTRVLNGPALTATSFNVAGGSLDVQSGSLSIAGGSLASGSTMTLSGGTVTNSGALNVAGTMALAGGTLAGAGTLNVSGTLNKTSAGTLNFSNTLNNTGVLEVFNGTLNLTGGGTHTGTFRADSGTTLGLTGGTHNFADGSHLAGTGSFVGGGSLNLTGTVAGLTVDAGTSINLNTLAFGGTGNLSNAGTVNGTAVTLGGALINSGTATLAGGTLGGGFSNTGTLNVTGNLTAGGATSTLAGGTINLGSGATLTKDTGTLSWSDGAFTGSGTLAYINGANFAFSGSGDRVINNPNLTFAFTNLNLPNGSLTLQNGGLTFSGTTVIPVSTSLKMYGGTTTNNGPLNVSGLFGLYGGTLAGNGAINMTGGTIDMPANSTVNWTATGPMSNTGTLNLANRTITNPITNSGTINAGAGLVFSQLFSNQGTFNLAGNTTTFSGGYSQSSGATQFGGGTLGGNASFTGGTLTGTGTINGTLSLGGAAYTLGAGNSWTSTGATSILAGASLGMNGGALNAAGLNIGGAFTYNSGTLSLSAPLNLNAGGSFNMAGAGPLVIGSAFNQAAGSTLSINGGTLDLAAGGALTGGTYTPAAGATLRFSGGSFALNGATTLGSGVQMAGSTFNGPGALTSTGILDITGNTTFNSLFTNSGTLTVSNGITLNAAAGYAQTAGFTKLGTGAGTSGNLIAGGAGFALNGGTLGGAGSVTGNLNVGAATVAAGFSPGTLNIAGNLTLAPASITNIEVGGIAAGSGFDVINVTGSSTLDGTLNVTSYLGYTPAAGTNYSFMNFGSTSGAFATTNLPGGWGINLNSYATYLDLLMPGALAAVAAPLTPLQALQQSIFIQPDALATNDTASGFNRVVVNDAETSLGQIVALAWQVSQNDADLMSLKQCQ